jgi:hypothetical protein
MDVKRIYHLTRIARYFVVAVFLSALVWLTACERILSGSEKADVLAFSQAATDNMFAGLTANDYAAFSRDFDTDMQAEIPAAHFAAWKQDLDNKLGNYLSRRVDQVTQADEFYVVKYLAAFEQENQVTVTVALHAAQPHWITFLAFDSEKGSWSAFSSQR